MQDYELSPPPEVFNHLQQLLEQDREGAGLARDQFKQLAEYEVQPPEVLRASIENSIRNDDAPLAVVHSPATQRSQKKVLFYTYRIAAACLLIAVATWGIYKMNNTKPSSQGYVAPKTIPANNNVAANTDTSSHEKNTGAIAETKPAPAYKPYFSFNIEGQRFPVSGNDFMATFTSFNYENMPQFISRDNNDRAVKVHLDQYTDMIISQPMAGMLKEMYRLKSNGEPTRKARKRRERLHKWKKTDEEYFDQSLNNPLDPTVLGKFIFK